MDKYRTIALIQSSIQESIEAKKQFLSESPNLYEAVSKIVDCYKKGKKVLTFGNGGSAADAQHITGELVGRFMLERRALEAICLSTDTSVLTAWANDYSYDSVFSRQVQAHAKKGDVLIGISTSGNSKNVIEAFDEGKRIGTYNISLTGKDGGKLKNLSDLNINVPCNNTPRVQECHMTAYHIICELVEQELFGKDLT
jgi:D-sedoheptulose 7-phosphate isomerase